MNSKSGLTIVEILVTISVMAILSSILVIYNRSSERQLILFKEQARLVSTLNRAKGMAMALLREPPTAIVPCGYGVHLSTSTYLIFKNLPDATENCGSDWNGSSEIYGETIKIDKNIEITASSTLTTVFFIPPDLKTIVNNDINEISAETIIKIKGSSGNSNRKVIKVNKAGQITAE